MNTNKIPMILMLIAGAVTSIAMYIMHYPLKSMLPILLSVLIVFYIIGLLIKKVLDSFTPPPSEAEEEGGKMEEDAGEQEAADASAEQNGEKGQDAT